MSAPSETATDCRLREDIQWADEVFGRAGGLTAAGVFAAAGAATQVVGFAVGDPKLHVKSGLRGLIPLHLRVSARVHHVSFLHPSLDTEFAHLAGGRDSGHEGSTPKKKSSSKDKKGYVNNLDLTHLYGSDYATGGGRDGGLKRGGAGSNSLEAVVLNEKRRLSRDGIVRDHADRKRRAARRGNEGNKNHDSLPQIKGKRKFVMLGADDVGDGKLKKDIPSPRDVKVAATGLSNTKQKDPKSTIRRGYSVDDGVECSDRKLPHPCTESSRPVVYDEEGITGDGPLLASVIMESPVAKIGRYLPETACRVPQCAVGFELLNDASRVKSTQPFVPEAPHIIWGGARDAPLKMVANDGNALVEARDLEYLTDTELDLAERTESLLVFGSTVWVDIPPEIKKDAKTSKHYAKKINKKVGKAVKKGGKHFKKGLTVTADITRKGATATTDITKKGANVIGKAATDAKKSGEKGMADFGEKIGKATEKVDKKATSAEKSSTTEADTRGARGGESVEEISQGAFGDESLEQVSSHEEDVIAGEVSTRGSKKGKKLKKMFKKTARAMHLMKKKDKSTIESDAELESVYTGASEDTDQEGLNSTMERSIESGIGDEDGDESNEVAVDIDDSSLLPDKIPYYTLVLDDVLQLRITGFPFSSCLATFPISVAAILSATSMEDRVRDPRCPSEITLTLVQEPSIMEGRWGVEMRVTLRAVEVRPDSAIAVEENPALDEKSGKWHRVKFSDKMKKFKIRLMNAGKSKEEIQAEIEAAEAKEEEEQEAREAAIVRAGIGRGYEQGAAMRDIVRRQMCYEPERIANQCGKRRLSSLDVEIIKAMAGHSFESEVLGRPGGTVSPLLPGTHQLSDMEINGGKNSENPNNAMSPIFPNSDASKSGDNPVEFPSSAGGFRLERHEVSDLTFLKQSDSIVIASGFTPASAVQEAQVNAVVESSQPGSLGKGTYLQAGGMNQLPEESTTNERTCRDSVDSASQVTATGINASDPQPPESFKRKLSASAPKKTTHLESPSLHTTVSINNESPDQSSSFVTARLAESFGNKQPANETNLESAARIRPTVNSSSVLQYSLSDKSESPDRLTSFISARSGVSNRQSSCETTLQTTVCPLPTAKSSDVFPLSMSIKKSELSDQSSSVATARAAEFFKSSDVKLSAPVKSESPHQSSSFVTARSEVSIKRSSSEVNMESTSRRLPTGKSNNFSPSSISVKSEVLDQPSSFVTARPVREDKNSLSVRLAAALEGGAEGSSDDGSQSQENGEGNAGESTLMVTENIDGAQVVNSSKVAAKGAEVVSEILPQLDRRKMMVQSHHVSGSGHKAESLDSDAIESSEGTWTKVKSVSLDLTSALEDGAKGGSGGCSQSQGSGGGNAVEFKQTVTENNDGAQDLNSAKIADVDVKFISEMSPQLYSRKMSLQEPHVSASGHITESANLDGGESGRGTSAEVSSVSRQLVTALEEGAMRVSVDASQSQGNGEGDEGESKQTVTESNNGAQVPNSGKVSPQLDRRKMMLQSHHVSGSGHKSESLNLNSVESGGEINQGSAAGATQVLFSSTNIGSGNFDEFEADILSKHVEAKMPQSMIGSGAPLDSIREMSESSEKSCNDDRENANLLNMAGYSVVDCSSPDRSKYSVAENDSDILSADDSKNAPRVLSTNSGLRSSSAGIVVSSQASSKLASHLISSVGSGNNASMDHMESKTSAQSLNISSGRYGMMYQSQGVSGGKLSLAESVAKVEGSKPTRRDAEDFNAFFQRLRREKLQEDYHRKKEARLALAARSVSSSSPPMSSIFARMSAIRCNSTENGTGTTSSMIHSSASGTIFDSLKCEESEGGGVHGIPWHYSHWLESFSALLKAVFLEEYPGVLFLIIGVGVVLIGSYLSK
uniref:Uncharacterized protein n=1 Tax=Odontella aurita TaxID=265563 RepID=A0A7S4JZP8_9STRA|mmetsp:Transcript_58031/g.173198  ORF Transcript_58031/g.173198 Transcript_58031/m.173198 type:complete len:1880 (+) Transcript_58031:46-5685(+)